MFLKAKTLVLTLAILALWPGLVGAQTQSFTYHNKPYETPSPLAQPAPAPVQPPPIQQQQNATPQIENTPQSAPSAASTDARITEDAIRKMYADSNNSYSWPYDQYLANLQKSMADDLQIDMTATVNVPTQGPVTKATKMDKASILKDAKQTYDSMQNTERSNEIVKIQISADGKTALVEDKSNVKHAPFAPMLYMEGGGPCMDSLVLSSAGGVQISKSTCAYEYNITTQ